MTEQHAKVEGRRNTMQVAPLRVRPGDVADLQKLFVRGIAKSRGQGSLTLTPEAVLQLESYSFPGNIKVPYYPWSIWNCM